MHQKITIISSFYNEEKNIQIFKEEINWAIKFLKKHQIEVFEIILIDNNSSDNTYKELNNLKFKDTKVLIFKNPKERSNYGDGFTKGFLEAKTNHVMTIHSDMQFHLSTFLEKNIEVLKKAIEENINIIPVRKGRKPIAVLRTVFLRIILSLSIKIIFQEYGGQPKLICKNHFLNVKEFPSDFSWDCFIYYWLKTNKKKINNECGIFENKRVHGISSWSNINLKEQFLFLLSYIKELKKTIKANEKENS